MTSEVPLACTILLGWNNLRDLLPCIAALRRQTYANHRIVVVDNGSNAEALAALEALGDAITLIRNGRNLGFAGGCNVGMRHAFAEGAAYAWLLNCDSEAGPDTLERLVRCIEAVPGTGLVSPVITETERPEEIITCGRFDWQTLTYNLAPDRATAAAWQRDRPREIVLLGTALLVSRPLFEATQGFDEKLFAYWEDTDLSIRCQQAGLLCRVDLDTTVVHATKTRIPTYFPYYMARNHVLMIRRHGHGIRLAKALLWCFLNELDVVGRASRPELAEATLAGLWDGWRGRGGPWDAGRRMPQPLRAVLRRMPHAVRRVFGARSR